MWGFINGWTLQIPGFNFIFQGIFWTFQESAQRKGPDFFSIEHNHPFIKRQHPRWFPEEKPLPGRIIFSQLFQNRNHLLQRSFRNGFQLEMFRTGIKTPDASSGKNKI